MRRWIGRGLQVIGLGLAGTGWVLPFFRDVSEGLFMTLGFGGFAVFWVGCRILGVGALG
jgi:hypothetical protein